ncbi:hypothetical protein GALL_475530 [mine drainage metagenome]|uniref:Uncharacterized protein n=1 Tax=mine drainage metagenome TaxID=410659 RepID=A0A1J5PGV3_9ZZZZ
MGCDAECPQSIDRGQCNGGQEDERAGQYHRLCRKRRRGTQEADLRFRGALPAQQAGYQPGLHQLHQRAQAGAGGRHQQGRRTGGVVSGAQRESGAGVYRTRPDQPAGAPGADTRPCRDVSRWPWRTQPDWRQEFRSGRIRPPAGSQGLQAGQSRPDHRAGRAAQRRHAGDRRAAGGRLGGRSQEDRELCRRRRQPAVADRPGFAARPAAACRVPWPDVDARDCGGPDLNPEWHRSEDRHRAPVCRPCHHQGFQSADGVSRGAPDRGA